MELKMTRNNFWEYVNDARKKYEDNFEAMSYLTDILTDKTNEEIFISRKWGYGGR